KHTYPVWQATFNARGDRLVTASFEAGKDGEVRIYSTATWQRLDSFRQPSAWRALLSPDGRQSLTVTDTFARLDRGPGGKGGVPLPHKSLVFLTGFSPDGRAVFTTTRDMTARLWDARGWPLSPALRH